MAEKNEAEVLFGEEADSGKEEDYGFGEDDLFSDLGDSSKTDGDGDSPDLPGDASGKFTDVYKDDVRPEPAATGPEIYGVGLYSLTYKIITSAALVLAAAAIGAAAYAVGYYLDLFFMSAIAFLPLANAVLMLIYVLAAPHGYNYAKNGPAGTGPKGTKLYRKQHNVYYNILFAFVVLAVLAVMDAAFIFSSNYLYWVMFQ